MKSIYLLIIPFVLFSCTDVYRAERLDKLDELTKRLNLELSKSNHELTDSVSIVITKASGIIESFKLNYEDDTIVYETALKLDAFQDMIAELNSARNNSENIKNQLNNRINIVAALRKDIENDAGRRARYDDDILFELEQSGKLFEGNELNNYVIRSCVRSFNDLYPDLLVLSSSTTMLNEE